MMQLFLQISLIVISIAGVFSVIQPMFQKIEAIQSETDEYVLALATAQEANARIADLNRTIANLSQQERHRLELLVPEISDPVEIAYEIENLILTQDIFLDAIAIAAPVEITSPVQGSQGVVSAGGEEDTFSNVAANQGEKMVAQDITVTVAGTYDQFKRLLSVLESSARLIDITSLAFQGATGDINTYTITLRTYGYETSFRNEAVTDNNE